MAVPSSVTNRIATLDKARKHVEDSRRGDRVQQERRAETEAYRKANRPVLLELAQEIFSWRDLLARSGLWSVIGAGARVYVFEEWFWDRMPIPAGNARGARTCIFLDGPHHHFLVEEWWNGDSGNLELHQEVLRLKSPIEMVDQLHPTLIELLQTHLSGPEAWQTIIDELDRRLARYQTA